MSYSRKCLSNVGREGGAQPINLGLNCWGHGDDLARKHIKHEILHAVGFLHEMNRPDRDSHITFYKTSYSFSEEDKKLWTLGDSKHEDSEMSKLATNYDFQSILHYSTEFGIMARNTFYNEVGFGNGLNMTATDKIALNILYTCPDVKQDIFKEFLNEETERTYVEMIRLNINPNEQSQR